MPNQYLQGADLAAFGVPNATAAQINQASSMIDAVLYRPEGLLWTPDASGAPCFMTGLSPIYSFSATGAIAPGTNVSVPASGPLTTLQPGDVLVLDRDVQNAVEACVVASTTQGAVTLASVQYAHNGGAKMDFGLVIEESKMMPKDRPLTQVSRTPTLRILSGSGRYGYGRRGDVGNQNMNDFNLLAAVSHFGGPALWEAIPAANIGVDMTTGQVWVPAGIMLAYYTEVKLRYVAGFQYANLPTVIKAACAALVQAIANQPQMGNVKSFKAGDTSVVNFTNSVFDDDMKTQLNPFRVHLFA